MISASFFLPKKLLLGNISLIKIIFCSIGLYLHQIL